MVQVHVYQRWRSRSGQVFRNDRLAFTRTEQCDVLGNIQRCRPTRSSWRHVYRVTLLRQCDCRTNVGNRGAAGIDLAPTNVDRYKSCSQAFAFR